jgi:hypothetical protein
MGSKFKRESTLRRRGVTLLRADHLRPIPVALRYKKRSWILDVRGRLIQVIYYTKSGALDAAELHASLLEDER